MVVVRDKVNDNDRKSVMTEGKAASEPGELTRHLKPDSPLHLFFFSMQFKKIY